MMRTFCLSTLLLASLTVLAEQDIINKSFNVTPGGTLLVDVDRGTLKILTSNTDKVEIEVLRELKRASADEAREAFDKHQINFTQDGETVRIEAENPGLNLFKNLFNNYRVEYTVTIPARFNLDLKTSGGSISAEDLDGKINARTSGGSIDLGATTGQIKAETSGGSIKIASGKSNVDAKTSGGSIITGDVDGNLTARTAGGGITLANVKGAIDANTSGGSIKISSAGGPVKATTNGGSVSAELSDNAQGECTLKTSGGSIKVTLPEKIAADLHASTSGGKVRSDFDGDLNKQQTSLVAKLNGGGPQMRISTSGGNVDIRKK